MSSSTNATLLPLLVFCQCFRTLPYMRLYPLWCIGGEIPSCYVLKVIKDYVKSILKHTARVGGLKTRSHSLIWDVYILRKTVDINFQNCCAMFFIHVLFNRNRGSLCHLMHLLYVLSSMDSLARSLLTPLSALEGAGLTAWALWRWWLNPWWTWGSWRPLLTRKTPTAPLMTERDRARPASRSPWYAWI